MSVTRKPAYDLAALHRSRLVAADRAGDFHAHVAGPGRRRPRDARASSRGGERRGRPSGCSCFWVLIGLLELVVHDSGNERRYVMFMPALVALAALVASGDRPILPGGLAALGWRAPAGAAPAAVPRLPGHRQRRAADVSRRTIAANSFHRVVVLSAGLASAAERVRDVAVAPGRAAGWPCGPSRSRWCSASWRSRSAGTSSSTRAGPRAGSELNYQASVALGRLLPPGTLVQGKLANGLALENRIRPLFIGNGFGNYDDRLERDDARYILTYDLPSIGYESQAGLRAHSGDPRSLSAASHRRDVRRRRDAGRRSGGAHRQAAEVDAPASACARFATT